MQRPSQQIKSIMRGSVDLIEKEDLLERLASKCPLRVKFGADPTAPDIHLGHTVILNKLRLFQDMGHRVVFIIGDFTARIGDPSGRTATRPALDEEQIKENAVTYRKQIEKILDTDSSKLEIRYNSEWLDRFQVRDLMGLAKRYTVARMIERDDFQKRYTEGVPITMLEFLYPLIQAYDSVEVHADVELGGSDQKFNLLVGREIQRSFGQKPQVVLTMPLLEGTDGQKKMSKSYDNYIGISEPPETIYGKVMSISDTLMYRYYELLTSEDMAVIRKEHPMEAKHRLAGMLVERFYEKTSAMEESERFRKRFSGGHLPERDRINEVHIKGTVRLLDFLVENTPCKSKTQARKEVAAGAVKIDGQKVSDVNHVLVFGKGKEEMILEYGKLVILRLMKRG